MEDEKVQLRGDTRTEWGSDAMAEALSATGVKYVTLNPGSSFRGLHDSLVNYLGNENPELLVCLHEEHAVAIGHGYAKVTGEPIASVLHSNVGLMHASMAIYNAFCDRMPMILIGATGPFDAESRRPWIDWIHTTADQAALVRPFLKWDDQPSSIKATVASIVRGNQLTRTHPEGPVFITLDAAVQEEALDENITVDVTRYAPVPDPVPSPADVAAAAELLVGSTRTVILAGRTGRDQQEWDNRLELAERLGAAVITDLKQGSAFPTDHRLHYGPPGFFTSPEHQQMLRDADVILSLDWVDLGGTLRQAADGAELRARVISASVDHHLFNGWMKNDHFLAAVDVALATRADVAVAELLAVLPTEHREPGFAPQAESVPDTLDAVGPNGRLTITHLIKTLRETVGDRPTTLSRVPFAWDANLWPMDSPLSFLGYDGGGGIGSGPGMAVGAALAAKGTDRMAIAVLGDGDYLMGLTAFWTAARYRIPMLIVVANNNSYFNDELHQERMADIRDRPAEFAHVGLRMQGPEPDLAQLAIGQGLKGFGPIRTPDELSDALKQAVDLVAAGETVVVDARVERGYSGTNTASSIARRPVDAKDASDD